MATARVVTSSSIVPGTALVAVAGLALLASMLVASCGVKATDSHGDENLPNAHAGPFRVLRDGEMPSQDRMIPYAIRRYGTRDPSALDIDGDPATPDVRLFVAASDRNTPNGPSVSILAFDAPDGRSFNPRTEDATVLVPSESWEGGVVGAPSVLRVSGELWMYYAAAGGVGLARSQDGLQFTKVASPVLTADASVAWESGAVPSEPSVVQVDDGSFRMFYVAGNSIGEARSSDGERWERLPNGPAVAPVAAPDFPTPDADNVYEPIDDVRVGGPWAVVTTSSLGRRILRVYYAGQNRIGLWSLGMVARYGADGVLERAYDPVLGNLYAPKGPSVVFFRDFTLVWFTAPEDKTKPDSASAIAEGVAPATVSLVLPSP